MPRPKGNGAGHGGPAKGEGWGGPAKGASTSRIDSGPVGDAIRALGRDPAHMATKEAKADLMLERIFLLGLTAERQETQLAAALGYRNQALGLPVARQITANVDDVAKVLRIEIIDAGADAETAGQVAVSPADND